MGLGAARSNIGENTGLGNGRLLSDERFDARLRSDGDPECGQRNQGKKSTSHGGEEYQETDERRTLWSVHLYTISAPRETSCRAAEIPL